MQQLPRGVRRLFEEPNFAHLATLMPDGSPQSTPVWVDTDGTYIIVNTAEGRQKPRNLRRDPRVAISIVDRHDPYVRAQIRGRVVEMTREGAEEHIDRLSRKYTGHDYTDHHPDRPRLILKIVPERITSNAPD